jgi:hypothetical protein
MSFLDNLEDNLKALEARDQTGIDDTRRREAERVRAQAEAPWADRLKNSKWTAALMSKVTRAGHQRRVSVRLSWIGTTLRCEARGQRLELRPAPDGIVAVFLGGSEEKTCEGVDLEGDPALLVESWMNKLDSEVLDSPRE